MDASAIALVRVIPSAYSWIAFIQCLAEGAGIRCARIWMVVSYEVNRGVKICVFMVSSVIFSVVPISFLRKAISLVTYWVTILSGDGREVVNFRRTWVWPSFVEALSSWSVSASHNSTGLWISLKSGRSS